RADRIVFREGYRPQQVNAEPGGPPAKKNQVGQPGCRDAIPQRFATRVPVVTCPETLGRGSRPARLAILEKQRPAPAASARVSARDGSPQRSAWAMARTAGTSSLPWPQLGLGTSPVVALPRVAWARRSSRS